MSSRIIGPQVSERVQLTVPMKCRNTGKVWPAGTVGVLVRHFENGLCAVHFVGEQRAVFTRYAELELEKPLT